MTRPSQVIAATLLISAAHTLPADAAVPVEITRIDGSRITGQWLAINESGKIGVRTKDRQEILSADDLISLRLMEAFAPTGSQDWAVTVW